MKSSILDLNGNVLKVATNLNPPFVTFDESNLPSGGFEITMLKELSELYNFKFDLVDCKSNWGVLQPNNTWTGIIGKIARKEVDFGMSAITITLDRSKVVQYSQPHYMSAVSFITPPPKLGQSLELVLEPFESSVWICLLFALLIMIINMWSLSQYYQKYKSLSVKWFMISLILKQSVIKRIPKEQPLRLVLSGWLLACLVFIQGYGSRLYTLMAFPEQIRPINTVEQLAFAQQNGDLQVVATASSLFYGLIKNSEFGVYKRLGELLEPIGDKSKGFELVKQSGPKPFAFISSRDNLIYGVLNIGKNLFHIPPDTDEATIYFAEMAIPMQIDFPYIEQFNSFLSHVKAGGLIDYWILKEYRKIDLSYELDLEEAPPLDKLGIKQFKSVLFMCLYLVILSFLVIIVEIVLDRMILLNVIFKLPFL